MRTRTVFGFGSCSSLPNVLSVASYEQRMRSLNFEVEDKSARPVLQKGLVKVSKTLKSTVLPLSLQAVLEVGLGTDAGA